MKTHLFATPDSVHHQCFIPQAMAFNEAGAELALNKNLVLASHLCPYPIPRDWILYNAEQIGYGIAADERYIEALKQYEVWDYSKLNIEELRKRGVINVKHCPIGYSPCLSGIPKVTEDIDVLFYGSINERRKEILDKLLEKCKLHAVFGVYGRPLYDLIARAKIIVNIHYYPTAIHEITRTSLLMANSKFIVSEVGAETDLENYYNDGIVFTKYEDIVDTTLDYLNASEEVRAMRAAKGFELFKAVSQKDIISALCA